MSVSLIVRSTVFQIVLKKRRVKKMIRIKIIAWRLDHLLLQIIQKGKIKEIAIRVKIRIFWDRWAKRLKTMFFWYQSNLCLRIWFKIASLITSFRINLWQREIIKNIWNLRNTRKSFKANYQQRSPRFPAKKVKIMINSVAK